MFIQALIADGESLDFDRVIEELRRVFPGTEVVCEDYYADRIELEKEISRRGGLPIPNEVIACTERVAKESGLTRYVHLRLANAALLQGQFKRRGFLLSTLCRVDESDIERILKVLSLFPNLRIEVSRS